MFADKSDMFLVKPNHLRRQEKYRKVIDFSMCIKAPAKGSMVKKQKSEEKGNFFHA
jgi:hypothetical protein